MKSCSIALVVLLSAASVGGNASADPLDWNVAIDTGGIWTAELGRDQPGEIRSLIGRTKGGRYDMFSVNIIIDNMTRVELLTEMGEELPKVSLVSGRIVVKRLGWPAGADKPVETVSCFAWNAASGTYEKRAAHRRALGTMFDKWPFSGCTPTRQRGHHDHRRHCPSFYPADCRLVA